jgi:hypothetical protein
MRAEAVRPERPNPELASELPLSTYQPVKCSNDGKTGASSQVCGKKNGLNSGVPTKTTT